MSNDPPTTTPPESTPAADFVRVQNSDDFALLRGKFRGFAFPMTVLFLIWYFVYVLMATYAPGVMSNKVIGNVNVGFLMGIGQFVSTFVITGLYVRHANRNLDPLAEKLRQELEPATSTGGI